MLFAVLLLRPGGSSGFRLGAGLGALVTQNGLAAQAHFVALDGDHFHEQLVAHLQLFPNVTDAMLSNLTNVQQAVGPWEYFDESAEIREPDYFTKVGLADLGIRQQITDHFYGLRRGGLVGGGHVDAAIIFHIDFDARLLNDPTNNLAPGTDEFADLRRIDLQCIDMWCETRDVRARSGQRLQHLAKHVEACDLGLA